MAMTEREFLNAGLDLSPMQKDVLATLDAFVERYGTGTYEQLYLALIELAARAVLGAGAVVLVADSKSDICPFCAAGEIAKRYAHEIDPDGGKAMHPES
jgi:hypothetical protein